MNAAGIAGAAGGALDIASGIAGMFSARRQNKMAVHNYKHRYQWAMKDMEKAGLNPVLAFASGQGAGNIGGPSAGITPTNASGQSASRAAGKLAGAQLENVQADIRQKDALTNKYRMESLGIGINNAKEGALMQEATERWKFFGANPEDRDRMWRSEGRGVVGRNLSDIEAIVRRIWGSDYRPSAQNSKDFMERMGADINRLRKGARLIAPHAMRELNNAKDKADYYRYGDFIPDIPWWMSPAMNTYQKWRGEDRRRLRRKNR